MTIVTATSIDFNSTTTGLMENIQATKLTKGGVQISLPFFLCFLWSAEAKQSHGYRLRELSQNELLMPGVQQYLT